MRIREKEEIRQRQSVLVDLVCDGIFHDQQLWQRQHRKRKQFYLSWWVHPHGEQGRNGKLPLGRSCWRRFAALWLAPEDYGKNNDYDERFSPQREQNKVSVWAQRNSSCPPERWSIRSVAEISLWPDLIIIMTMATTMTIWGRKCQLEFQSVQLHWVLTQDQVPFSRALHQPDIQQHL